MPTRFTIEPRGPFSLDAARTLACGFLLSSRACAADGALRLAFPLEGGDDLVAVELREADARVDVVLDGTVEIERARRQLAHALALDVDARPFAALMQREAALAAAWARRPRFRPPVAYSPYVMAGWCVLSQRTTMRQAAVWQRAIAERLGTVVDVGGSAIAAFPPPRRILAHGTFAGIPEEKWTRLRAVASAALDGLLDLPTLRALPYDAAVRRLRAIRGIGRWSADGILVRGAGLTDVLPLSEPSLHQAVRDACGLAATPSDDEVVAIAERWRPFRTWVSVLLISLSMRKRP